MWMSWVIKLVTPSMVASWLRHLLSWGAGILTTRALLTPDAVEGWITAGVALLFPVVWGTLEKLVMRKWLEAAADAPSGTPVSEIPHLVALRQRTGW